MTKVIFRAQGYKWDDFASPRYAECKRCGHTVIVTNTHTNPHDFRTYNPEADSNKEYIPHVCPSGPGCIGCDE